MDADRNEERGDQDDISLDELLYWAEFSAWTALVLTPLLWWFNGPSVSTDQFVVRTLLVMISAVSAVTLRSVKYWNQRKQPKIHDQITDPPVALPQSPDDETNLG